MAVQLPPNRGPCQSSSFNTYHWTELKKHQNLPDVVLYVAGVLVCFGLRDLITTMPDRLDVLTGSCVQIPCSFDIPDKNKYTFNSTILTSGVWIKENSNFGDRPDNVIFNSSKTVNRYQGKITGNMSQKNCTTVFFNVTTNYTNIYFLRIESQPYRATDPDKSINIVVRGKRQFIFKTNIFFQFRFLASKIRVEQVDSLTVSVNIFYLQCITDLPSSPIITVSGEVKEGTPVSLNCSAVAPCPEHPPELTWTLPNSSHLRTNCRRIQTKSVLSTVTFTRSYLHHEKNVTCTSVYPVGTSYKTAEHNMMLNVSCKI